MQRIVLLTIVVCLFAAPVGAVNYFVSSSGNDGSDGLTLGTAWKSLDNGDIKGLLSPGDTVLVLPGVYLVDRSYVLTSSGTVDDPVVYLKAGTGPAAIRTLSGTNASIRVQADNIVLCGLDVSCDIIAGIGGIEVTGNSCLVTQCSIHKVNNDGIKVAGNDNTVLKNLLWSCGADGIKTTATAGGNRLYGNTVYESDLNGVEMLGAGNQNRVFNNVIALNGQYGISGSADNVCGFNGVWNNPGGDYSGGVADSSGGMSVDPMFVDGPAADFDLLDGSPAINAGLDLGYAFHDAAPDMGAREHLGTSPAGMAVWRSGGLSTPRYNEWDGSAFGTAGNSADVGTWRIIAGAEAPTRDEVIVIGVDDGGNIAGEMWDGVSWSALPFNPIATASESFWWGFDVAYEERSGRALVVWNNGSGGAAGLSYRTWDGSDWSDETAVATPLAGEPKQIHLAAKPSSNEMVLVVSNQNSEDYALIWDGAAWGNGRELDISGGDDGTDVYAAYERQTGHALVVYGKASSALYYRTWDGTAWGGEGSLEEPADASGNVRWTTLAADPQSDNIALGVLTFNQEIWLGVWNGETWEASETASGSATGTTHPCVAVAFEGSSGEALAVYGEPTAVRYRTWASGDGWSLGQTMLSSGVPSNSIMLEGARGTDHVMLSMQDDYNDLDYGLWYGDIWGTPKTQEVDTGESKNQPFIFLWERSEPIADLDAGKTVDHGTPTAGDVITYTITLTNNGPSPATGIEVVDLLPAGVSYGSDTPSQGTYNSGTGVWSVGDLSSGSSATLDLGAAVDPGTEGQTITNLAEVTALLEADPFLGNDADGVAIVVNRPPEMAAIGPKAVGEGQNLTFTVSASDPDGTTPALAAEAMPANSGFLDNSDGTGTFGFDPDYTQAGTYDVLFIASDGALADSEAVTVTVAAAPLAYIVIDPDSAVVSADSSVMFAASGYDAGGEEEATGTITWSLVDPLGSIDSTGLFDASTVGVTKVVGVSALGPADTTAYLEIIPGDLVSLSIGPDRATVSADSTLQFTASGHDADGNATGDLGNLTWQVLGDIGTIASAGLFTARRAGTGFIGLTSDLSVWAQTDTITVVPGDISFIDVIPSSQVVVEESPYQFTVNAFDADSNLVADATADAGWSTSDPSGSVTAAGLYTAGTDLSPPAYSVTAELSVPLGTLQALTDSSAVTVISSGSLHHVRVEFRDGTEFGDTTLAADNDTTRLYCRGYDSADTLIGDFAAAWSVVGGGSVGSVDYGPAVFTLLGLAGTGSIRVAAEYNAGMADTTGLITCIAGKAATLAIAPDTATASAGQTIQFAAEAFDADLNPAAPVAIDGWSVVGTIGEISETGLFTATASGTGFVACWGGGLLDTTGSVSVVPGNLTSLEIQPDSVEVGLGGSVTFAAEGFDAFGNAAAAGDLTWEVIGDIGEIDTSGTFTALAVGTGRVKAASSIAGVVDTNSVVVVNVTDLEILVIAPDTASVRISGQIEFSAYGFDASFDPVEVGRLAWEVLGGIGTIDDSGRFTATNPGAGRIAATSVGGAGDTTDMIVVGVPTIEEMSIGHRYVHAGDEDIPILSFRIANAFDGRETVERIIVRDASRGAGTRQQVASNFDTVALYMDADESLSLSSSDVPISRAPLTSDSVALSFPPVTIGPGADRTFFVSVDISAFPRDGDSLDMYLLPATDIEMAGGTAVAGADSINSLGYDIVDGLVAAQVVPVPTGTATIAPEDGLSCVLAVDIPRNGYSSDVLRILSVFNSGSADTADIDSLVLYRDGGDGVWSAPGDETRIGRLSFTGDQWQLSGLWENLKTQMTRFYIGAAISPRAASGRTLALGIPLHGLETASDNDGPIDVAVLPVETISIDTPQMISASVIDLAPRGLVPGSSTGPVLAIELRNGYAVPVLLDTLRVESGFKDPAGATQDMLDGQVEALRLWLDLDGDCEGHSPSDSLVASAQLDDGTVSFPTPGLILPPEGGIVRLFIECELGLTQTKNDNLVSFRVESPEDLRFGSEVSISGDFPLTPARYFTVNSFPAAAVEIFPVPGTTLFGLQTNGLLLDFALPTNGYADDRLRALRIVNTGTTADGGAIAAVRLWADAGEAGLSGDDILLGELDYREGGIWEIEGLSVQVSEGGRRFLVTGDVAAYGFEGGTARFELPLRGAEYFSGMDGPDDANVGNAESHFLFPANRVTVIPIPREFATVKPGAGAAEILTYALYNGYPDETHVLRDLRLKNDTRTSSSAEFADFEIGQVSLYYDRNSSRAFDDDSLLATGYFDSGTLNLSGLDIALAAESLAYFFVTAALPVGVIDADTLAVTIEGPSDFSFMESVNINGDFPVSRGGDLVVDGSVRTQYRLLDVESQTLARGDQSVPVLAFRPAANGDMADVLDSLLVTNIGSAIDTDITSLRLYLDANGDDRWQPVDTPLGEATNLDGIWLFADLGLEIADEAKTLLVVADISEGAGSGGTIRFGVPVGGCRYASSNDGPRDEPVMSGQTFVISGSVLKVTYENPEPSYSVGQGLDLRVRVTNLLGVPISGVRCDIEPAVDGLVGPDSAFTGPVALGPNDTVEFRADYTAFSEGETYWRIQAFCSDPEESSGVILTAPTVIQSVPEHVSLEMVGSVPAAVTRGQTRIFPLSIRYSHSEALPLAASVRLDSVRIHIRDESGLPQAASGVFSRLILATGYANLAVIDTFPDEPFVVLRFFEPAFLAPGQEQVLSLRVDIDSAATAGSFALALDSEADLRFVDCNTSIPVPIDPGVAFPLETASCRISSASRSLAVSYVPSLGEAVNRGQQDVDVIRLVLRHPGTPDESQVQLTGLSFKLVDAGRQTIAASDVVESIRLVRQQTVVGELVAGKMASDILIARLTAPPVVSPGETDTVKVQVSIRPEATEPVFGLEIEDSTWFALRDLSSGAVVTAVSDGQFPMWSGAASLMAPAEDPEVCPESRLPESLIAGRDSVGLVEVTVRHPGDTAQSPLRLESLRVAVTDSIGIPLDPRLLFDRMGLRIAGGPLEYREFTTVAGGLAALELGPAGVVVEPGGSLSVALAADLEADAPYDHFMLRLYREDCLVAIDDTDRDRNLAVRPGPSCAALPFASNVAGIFLPAGSPVVRPQAMESRIGYPGQTGLVFFRGELAYKSTGPQADLVFGGITGQVLSRTESGLAAVTAAEAFEAVYLLLDDVKVAVDSALAGTTISLAIDPGYVLTRGAVKTVTLACDLRPEAPRGNYLVSFIDSTFMSLVDHDLEIPVSPVLAGAGYPLVTADISIMTENLSGSFVNWPNPFNPDRETTRFGFVLKDEARVDLEVFTITGELVRRLVSDESRPAGPSQDDTWNGTNGGGRVVLPGTYVCRIAVRYGSGESEEATRRVAVIR